MFFEKETLSLNILDVLELRYYDVNLFNSGRNFGALSFRFRSDATLITEHEEYKTGDNYVSYVPARFDYRREASIDELIVVHFDTSDYFTDSIECFEAQNPEKMKELFKKLLDTWNGREVGYKHKCTAILYDILAECYLENFRARHKDSKIRASVDYLQAHFKESSLTVEEVAKKSFMSEVYFRKLFKKEYGISPQKYIVNLRIQNAVGLISSGYYSLAEVAYMSGYNDYKYFSVEFKKALGVSPSKYSYNYNRI